MARLTSGNLTNPFFTLSEPNTAADVPEPITPTQSTTYEEAKIQSNLELQKDRRDFHLLIPASESNPEFCKTLLSASVLGYPAPTLINWGMEMKKGKIIEESASHLAKIKGVYDFLRDTKKTKDGDMVLIIDGYDVWFQLPPHILLERYHTLVEETNSRLVSRYGMISEDQNGDSLAERVPKYELKVLLGADKLCWPNPHTDPACVAVPFSTLPKDLYGADTDTDPKAYHNRPRWLNSGNIMGRAKDVRAVYEAALRKIEKGAGGLGDQYVFAEVFGEQEYLRETRRQRDQGTGGRWLDYLSKTLGTSESPLSANVTMKNMTISPRQQYEYGIGLDYESQLFQTMTHSADDIDFIYYNSSTDLLSNHHSLPLFLPKDLQAANPPLTYASPGNHSIESDPKRKTLLLPYSPQLDNLPDQNAFGEQLSWRAVPLATNTYAASIPALLHINGDKSLLKSWWPKIWFHPYGRALLRRFIRSTQTIEAAKAADEGGKNWFDMRGGRGGVWTDKATWMSWKQVCKGTEEDLFADGKGEFGKEEGDPKRINSFNKVIIEGD